MITESLKIYRDGGSGVVKVSGSDALGFLNRSVTNDIEGLEDGEARRTLFLTPEGRTRADMQILRRGDDLLVVSEKSGGLAEFWRDNIFIEDVEIEETDMTKTQVFDLTPGEVRGDLSIQDDVYLYRNSLGTGVISSGNIDIEDGEVVDEDKMNVLRVERGVPSFEKELEDRIPLEAEMYDIVDFEKGCYVGQEVVARIEDRGGGPEKTIRGFEVDENVETTESIHRDGDVVGEITSVAESPRYGRIALGFIDRGIDPSEELQAGIEDSGEVVVRKLPFREE